VRRRSLVISLFGIMLIAFIALGATLVAGRSPLLGLDLEGGVSVVLQPHGHVTDSELQTAVNIIDSRVNGIGVANSTVDRQGNDVVIELPGTKNASKDIKVIGTTAQLFFRPVDCTILPYAAPTKSTTTTTNPKSSPTTTPGHTGTNSTPSTAPHSSSTTAKSSAGSPSRAALTAFVQRGSTVRSQLTGSPAPLASGATSTTTPPASSTTAPSTTAPSTTVPSTTVPPTSTSTPGTTTPTTAPASTGTKSTDRTAYLA
jgi:preprotein translocase subunit SecD